MAAHLSKYCIYTIVHGDKLPSSGQRRSRTFREAKRWVTGLRLWRAAQDSGVAMPVLFADARDCSRVLGWGVLNNVELDSDGTSYSVDHIRRFTELRRPQDLRLRTTGKRMAANFIRPYALCFTPAFLKAPPRG